MRCVLAIVWNRNREIAQTLYEMNAQEFSQKLQHELKSISATTLWQRIKALWKPLAPPDFAKAIDKVFQDFKNQTIAAHQVRKPEDKPEIDWRYTDSIRRI